MVNYFFSNKIRESQNIVIYYTIKLQNLSDFFTFVVRNTYLGLLILLLGFLLFFFMTFYPKHAKMPLKWKGLLEVRHNEKILVTTKDNKIIGFRETGDAD